jgi:hypothetical protein
MILHLFLKLPRLADNAWSNIANNHLLPHPINTCSRICARDAEKTKGNQWNKIKGIQYSLNIVIGCNFNICKRPAFNNNIINLIMNSVDNEIILASWIVHFFIICSRVTSPFKFYTTELGNGSIKSNTV